ncbi:NAD(P)H-binding protein [Halobacillus salinarum]|uniref:NAD(P)H-binding protein n=1 Tax=Halobacillus salinarum TaxID=2932257 RepID=A0ABY4EGD8_9BACI|nr:NAD(P)H-binding protein [Halobacillus salinarum]UOQ43536.1 NAD(P)H-binding protein [Halobacillus salinarum]
MKVAVLGGTGRVGSSFIKYATEQDVQIRALVRDKEKALRLFPQAEILEGNALNREDLSELIKGCDVVFSALNTDKTTTLSTAMPKIIKEMEEAGVDRILTIGTAGILNSRYEQGKYRYETKESKRTKSFAAEEHLKAFISLKNSQLQWTIVCPTHLPDGKRIGKVRSEREYLPKDGKKIGVADTAFFAYRELIESRFLHSRVGISY